MLVDIAVQYFQALDDGAYDAVAQLFSPDASYVRPQKTGTVERGAPKARQLRESVGREARRALLAVSSRQSPAERCRHWA